MREKTFELKWSDYKVHVFETEDGKVYAEDNYGKAEFKTWDEALKRAQECIDSTPDEPPVPEVDQTWYSGLNAGHWGLGDLYPSAKENLEKIVKSGKPYNTGFFGSKKDESSARIINNGKEITVEVVRYMDGDDDPAELIYDAMNDDDIFSETEIEEMVDDMLLGDYGASEGSRASLIEKLPLSATFEDIENTIKKLDNETDSILKERFEEVKGIVSEKRKHKRTHNAR